MYIFHIFFELCSYYRNLNTKSPFSWFQNLTRLPKTLDCGFTLLIMSLIDTQSSKRFEIPEAQTHYRVKRMTHIYQRGKPSDPSKKGATSVYTYTLIRVETVVFWPPLCWVTLVIKIKEKGSLTANLAISQKRKFKNKLPFQIAMQYYRFV